jgi:hypothetical protein
MPKRARNAGAVAALVIATFPALADEPVRLPAVEVIGRYQDEIGVWDSASQGAVTREGIEKRPLLRPGEVLEAVPGMAVTQHSGDGKANQYFLRGYNLDHGTDFATWVAGMPVNIADPCPRPGLHRPQLRHPGADLACALQQGPVLRSGRRLRLGRVGADPVRRPAAVQRRDADRRLVQLHAGFGFSFMLQNQLQFAGDHLLLSLLAFNIGIELGQLLCIVVAIPLLSLLFAKVRLSERVVTVVISAFVAHAAWHWLAERWDTLAKVEWPEVNLVTLGLWIALAAALAVLAWTLLGRVPILRRRGVDARSELAGKRSGVFRRSEVPPA